MKWVKAPDQLKTLLEEAMAGVECEKRSMFGYPAYFINKNMFIGLFQDQLFVRLSKEQLDTLRMKNPSIANLEPVPGRAMKDYFVLPKELYSVSAAFKRIIAESATYTRALAPKTKKSRKNG